MIESSFSTLEVYFLTPPQVLPQLTLKVTFLSQPRFAPARRRPAGPTPPLDRDGTARLGRPVRKSGEKDC